MSVYPFSGSTLPALTEIASITASKKALAKEAKTQKAELKKVPQLKKAGKKETEMA